MLKENSENRSVMSRAQRLKEAILSLSLLGKAGV